MTTNRVEILTAGVMAWSNRASLNNQPSAAAKKPLFRVEGKQFLLTATGQSVMNIFTASGAVCNFVFVSFEH
jgi:hypothetical protein